jgi:hypothetical protein
MLQKSNMKIIISLAILQLFLIGTMAAEDSYDAADDHVLAEFLSTLLEGGKGSPDLSCLLIEKKIQAVIQEQEKLDESITCSINLNDRTGNEIPFNRVHTALVMASMSKLAYAPYNDIRTALSACRDTYIPGVGQLRLTAIHQITGGSEGFVAADSSARVAIVAFRGSATGYDWWKNFLAKLSPIGNSGVKIHYGTKSSLGVYNGIKNALNSRILQGWRVYITGHSRGGMLADVFTYMLAQDYPTRKGQFKVYTFGAPAIGNQQFANFFNDMESYGVTVIGDPVSYERCALYKSMHALGYVKVPKVVYLPNQGGHSISTYIEQLKSIQSQPAYMRENGLQQLSLDLDI